MRILNSMLIAFSMYSKIPVPAVEWKKENMRYVMCFFPLVGTVLGFLYTGLFLLCRALGIGQILSAVLLTLLPVLLSGGIHMDGLMDTMDALGSYQSREKKLEILKYSRAGAFAVLSCGCYLLLSFGQNSEFFALLSGDAPGTYRSLLVLALGFTVSRAFSGLSVVSFPCAKSSGLAAGFSETAVKRAVKITMGMFLAVCAVLMFVLSPGAAAGMWLAALLSFWYYHRMSGKEFGGITGDLAGFFLQVCELVMMTGWLIGFRLCL